MPMARKNMKIVTFIALLHLLCGHNALNLTVTTMYLLAAVTFMFLEALSYGQPVRYSVTIYSWILTSYIDIVC